MKRRYDHDDPEMPIDIIEDEEIGECSAIVKKGKQETKKILVKVVKKSNSIDEEEESVTFQIETDIPLRWVMIGFCQKLGLDFQTTRFEFNSAKLRQMDTPHQLGMVHDDVIFAFIPGGSGYSDVDYATVCIRMHKETNMFLNVRRSTAILPQLRQEYFPQEQQGPLSFVYAGLKLTENHTAKELNMENGDVIDGFNFNTMSSSLGIILTLKVKCRSGYETMFRVTKSTRLDQIMDRLVPLHPMSTQVKDIRFEFNFRGKRLEETTKTVEEVQLKDGDVILCVPYVLANIIRVCKFS
ncbi:hypothetical protein SOVF_016690 [Spinacia oleracea]|uniref:Ubiquitin-like domain-containing protein n=1 Tax=Spinacia oleracea TaxID=3562 RepID=A0ABM3QWP8_SPIOL|nr:uncharacterized protein LOC130462838 [Spinacia oleracea]XP_056687778.1 uncharacterized protein LOC130462838 [Spinacia oleracea]KNA24309.1 hypothetical protein SOVF_016690 [Spinacia oleracea]